MYAKKICDVCGKSFQPISGAQKKCSVDCSRIFKHQQNAARWKNKHLNRCNTCGIEIEKYKRFCKEHRKKSLVCVGFLEKLKLEKLQYERMMKLNDSIIHSQQKQIDELLERNQELQEEKRWLERRIDLLGEKKDAEFNFKDSKEFVKGYSRNNRMEKSFNLGDF